MLYKSNNFHTLSLSDWWFHRLSSPPTPAKHGHQEEARSVPPRGPRRWGGHLAMGRRTNLPQWQILWNCHVNHIWLHAGPTRVYGIHPWFWRENWQTKHHHKQLCAEKCKIWDRYCWEEVLSKIRDIPTNVGVSCYCYRVRCMMGNMEGAFNCVSQEYHRTN